jgi:hypothetical protein
MEYFYGIQPLKFGRFDGTNIQEIADEFCPPGTVVDGSDRIYLTGTGSGDFDSTLDVGDLVSGGPSIYHPADWNENWARVLGPGEGNA